MNDYELAAEDKRLRKELQDTQHRVACLEAGAKQSAIWKDVE